MGINGKLKNQSSSLQGGPTRASAEIEMIEQRSCLASGTFCAILDIGQTGALTLLTDQRTGASAWLWSK
jgi:hypothetical protein